MGCYHADVNAVCNCGNCLCIQVSVTEYGFDSCFLCHNLTKVEFYFGVSRHTHQCDSTALLYQIRCLCDGNGRACCFKYLFNPYAVCKCFYFLQHILFLRIDYSGCAQLHCVVQTLLRHIYHCDIRCTASLASQQCHQTDTAGAKDNALVAHANLALVCRMQTNSKRLNQCAFLCGHPFWQLEAHIRRECDIVLIAALHRRSCKENNIGA